MPLASMLALQWYGPAAGAVVGGGSGSVSAGIAAWGSVDAALAGVGAATVMDATRLVNSPATIIGVGLLASGSAKLRARPSMTVSIGSRPSADDVAQAVWGASAAALSASGSMGAKLNSAGAAGDPWSTEVENGLTALQAMRLVAAALAGELSGAGTGTVTIRSAVADDTNRIVATVDDDGNRSTLTLDLD